MPELVNSKVGSLPGTSDAEGTIAWPRAAKKARKSLRITAVVFMGGGRRAVGAGRHAARPTERARRRRRGRWNRVREGITERTARHPNTALRHQERAQRTSRKAT